MRWSRIAVAGAVVAATAVVSIRLVGPADAAEPSGVVTVNTRAGLATVRDTALGVNHAIWDPHLGTDAVADLLKDAGVQMMRYPGGSYADIYHWRDHTAPGGYVAPNTDFDTFMAGVRRAGAAAHDHRQLRHRHARRRPPTGSGTPTSPRATASKYWTIGNENYGNGHYGAAWEADNHADKSPAEYAHASSHYAEAMKAVDPTIKVGAVLTMPGNWPDGIVGAGDAGHLEPGGARPSPAPSIDFVDVHWYPGGGTAAEALGQDRAHQRRGLPAAPADHPVRRRERRPDRHQPDRDQRRRRPEHPAGRAVPRRRLQRACWPNGRVHRRTGGTSTTASARCRRSPGRPTTATSACSPAAAALADGSVCEPPMNTPFAPYHALTHDRDRSPGRATSSSGPAPTTRWSSAHAVPARQRRPGRAAASTRTRTTRTPSRCDYAGYTPAPPPPTVLDLHQRRHRASATTDRAAPPARRCRRTR